nr:hypothetical protein [Tanacetum cinerariifolium]
MFPLLSQRDAYAKEVCTAERLMVNRGQRHINISQRLPQEDGVSESSIKKKGITVVVTTKDMQKRRNDVKARTTLLLALPDEHQLRFSKYKTAKELWDAILKSFGGNEATKKTKKNQLKQYSGKGEVNTASISTTITQVSLTSADVAAASFSHDTVCAYIASQSNGSQIKYEDINQIDEDDIEEMDIKWNMAFLSMRANRFWKNTRKKITIQGTDVVGFDKSKGSKVEESAPKALMAIDGVGWDWSYMANKEENHALVADEETSTKFALMAKSSSSSKNEIRGLEFNVESKNNRIERLTNELEEIKKEKEGLDSKLIVLFSHPAQVYSPRKKDMSWIRLPEFADDTITDYSRPSPSIERYWDSGCSRHMTGNISYLSDYEPYDGGYVSFRQGGGKITGKGIIKIGKLEFKNVYFVKDLKYNLFSVSQICDNKNSVLFTDSECIVLGRDFKLKDDTNVLVRTPRQHNMYSIDLNNIVLHKDLTCLVAKASADENETSGILRNFITEIENLKELKAEAVNTTCYVQNRVLVNKSKNKTPYELFNGRTPAIGFLKPFGCHVMILNTLDHLGKFDAKGDEGYFIGYSMSSKEFRVFNKRTKRVEENLHVDFLENKLIEKGAGLNWLFNIDTLTNSMNYVPLMVAGTSSTNFSSTKDAASQDVKKDVSSLRYTALLNWFHEAHLETSSSNAQDACNADAPKSSGNSNPTATSINPSADQLETLIVESIIPTVSTLVLIACLETSPETTSGLRLISKRVISQDETPSLDNISTLSNRKNLRRVRPIGTKWVLKNKKDERGIVIRNKARLVAQGHTHEKGINYEEVFAPVARIEAIRLFLAYASFMGFTVYQMDVKSAFLYGTIDEEVYVMQPFGFQDPEFLNKVYKVEKAMGTIDQNLFIRKHRGDFILVQVSSNTPMDKENPWGKDRTGKDVDLYLYGSMIGSLIYLKGHPKLGLWYPKESPFGLVAYSDSDYGGATQDRKSTTRGCQFLGRRLISWKCKKQTIMATSTTEAKYVAAASGCRQVLWIQN